MSHSARPYRRGEPPLQKAGQQGTGNLAQGMRFQCGGGGRRKEGGREGGEYCLEPRYIKLFQCEGTRGSLDHSAPAFLVALRDAPVDSSRALRSTDQNCRTKDTQ